MNVNRAVVPPLRQSGFTLIEILVVVVIIGVLSGVAVLSVGGGDVRELRSEAKRLHQLFTIVADNAVFEQREYGILIDEKTYAVSSFNNRLKHWQLGEEPEALAYSLPNHIGIELTVDGELSLSAEQSQNTSSSFELQLQDDEKKGDSNDEPPQLLFLSSGELTAFSLVLFLQHKPQYQVIISSDGIETPAMEVRLDD